MVCLIVLVVTQAEIAACVRAKEGFHPLNPLVRRTVATRRAFAHKTTTAAEEVVAAAVNCRVCQRETYAGVPDALQVAHKFLAVRLFKREMRKRLRNFLRIKRIEGVLLVVQLVRGPFLALLLLLENRELVRRLLLHLAIIAVPLLVVAAELRLGEHVQPARRRATTVRFAAGIGAQPRLGTSAGVRTHAKLGRCARLSTSSWLCARCCQIITIKLIPTRA
eukprot:114083-Pleurochrysis_carterae.AAC.1